MNPQRQAVATAVGIEVRAEREGSRVGLTRRELAGLGAGFTAGWLAQVETGRRLPSSHALASVFSPSASIAIISRASVRCGVPVETILMMMAIRD